MAFSRRPAAHPRRKHLRGLPVLVHEVSRRVWGLRLRRTVRGLALMLTIKLPSASPIHSLLHAGLSRRTGLTPPSCRTCSGHQSKRPRIDRGRSTQKNRGNRCYGCGFAGGGVAGFGVAAGFAAATAGGPPLTGYARSYRWTMSWVTSMLVEANRIGVFCADESRMTT